MERAHADLLRGGHPWVTLDGYIAAPDGSFDFFPVDRPVMDLIAADFPETLPTHARAHLGITAPGTRFGTVIMGRSTYEPALRAGITSPYAHLDQYVVSTTLGASEDPRVHVVADDPLGRVRQLKQQPGAGLWLAGGGRLAGALLEEIDHLVLKRYPVVLGAGIPVIASAQARASCSPSPANAPSKEEPQSSPTAARPKAIPARGAASPRAEQGRRWLVEGRQGRWTSQDRPFADLDRPVWPSG